MTFSLPFDIAVVICVTVIAVNLINRVGVRRK